MIAREAPWIRARVVPGSGVAGAIERIGPLTPYLTQTIVEDALAAGQGTTVLIDVRWTDASAPLEALRRRVEVLTSRGIHVSLRSGEGGATTPFGRSAA
jgi:hypothetical protein